MRLTNFFLFYGPGPLSHETNIGSATTAPANFIFDCDSKIRHQARARGSRFSHAHQHAGAEIPVLCTITHHPRVLLWDEVDGLLVALFLYPPLRKIFGKAQHQAKGGGRIKRRGCDGWMVEREGGDGGRIVHLIRQTASMTIAVTRLR
jgi:hypothetical protein